LPKDLQEAFVLANTPGYFYRACKRSPFVAELVLRLGIDGLTTLVTAQIDPKHRLEEEALAYCALLGIFGADVSHAEKLKVADQSRLPWAFDLLALATASTLSTTRQAITFPHVVGEDAREHVVSSTLSSTRLDLANQ